MITDLILMNGYGIYVWSAFAFTLISFSSLYFIINSQLKKEQKRFEENFSMLSEEKYNVAMNQEIHKEILKYSGSKI
jgi:Heme exporter protein D